MTLNLADYFKSEGRVQIPRIEEEASSWPFRGQNNSTRRGCKAGAVITKAFQSIKPETAGTIL